MEPPVCRQTVTVNLPDGLHLRPMQQIVRLAMAYPCEVRILRGEQATDAKSMFDVMTLNAPQGTTLILEACGERADEALVRIVRLFETNFAEEGTP